MMALTDVLSAGWICATRFMHVMATRGCSTFDMSPSAARKEATACDVKRYFIDWNDALLCYDGSAVYWKEHEAAVAALSAERDAIRADLATERAMIPWVQAHRAEWRLDKEGTLHLTWRLYPDALTGTLHTYHYPDSGHPDGLREAILSAMKESP